MLIAYTNVGQGAEKVMVFYDWFGDHNICRPTFHTMDQDNFCYCFLDYRGYAKSRALSGDYSMRETPVYLMTSIENFF